MTAAADLDCSPAKTVDGDVVGPGVLAAFLITATITIIAVVFGYLTDALDDDLLNSLDRRIIVWTHKRWTALKAAITRIEHKPSGLSRHHKKAMAGIRKEVITQFILVLSDQQLVTGLAVLIAGVSNQRTLTGYEFSIILSQAWFSSTTHLATLDALRNYLGTHGLVRDIRVAGMVSVLVLLIYTFLVTLLTSEVRTVPVQCLFVLPFTPSPSYAAGGAAAVTLLWTALTYALRIQDLYVHQKSPWYLAKWLVWRRRAEGSSFREHLAEKRARARVRAAYNLPDASWLRRLAYGYGDSFLASIPGIAFSFSFGVSQVVTKRWGKNPKSLTSQGATMNYSQILPLLLLCLPFLATGESYYDYMHKRYEHLRAESEQSEFPIPGSSTQNAEKDVPTMVAERTTTSGDAHDDLVAAGAKFDQEAARIKKYFFADVTALLSDGKTLGHMEILRRKQSILSRYQSIEECEKHIETAPAIALFCISVALSSTTGVLLNIGNETVLEVCIGLGVVYAGTLIAVAARSP